MVKLLLPLLLAVLPLSVEAASPPGKEDFDAATRLFNAEEYEAALPYFERAYERSGRRPATVLALAQCLRALKRYDEAIARFEEYRPNAGDNAKEIDETLALLTELKQRQHEKSREEAAALERERQSKEFERARAVEAEQQRSLEATRATQALARDAAQKAAEEAARRVAKEAEEHARLYAPSPAPPEPEGGVLSSPLFWVITGAAAVGGGLTAVYFATRSREDPYAGSSGVVLVPGN